MLLFICAGITLTGCASLRAITQPKSKADNAASRVLLPSYSGPKAHIAVADFDVKVATVSGEIGIALRQMLTNALINSYRFSVIERQVLSSVMQEQGVSVAVAPQAKNPDLIIAASLTEFEPQTSGGREGVGGGGGVNRGALGGLLGVSLNKARMALDIRIVEASTSQVLAATRVQGQTSDTPGSNSGGFFGAGGLGPGLSIYADTPMEKAMRICIVEAVRYIYQNIPQHYYKYNGKT